MVKKILKSKWQHILAVVIFVVITAIQFSPVLKGYSIQQGDITSYAGMTKENWDYRKLNNMEEPIWTNSMFGGMPSYQMDVYYSDGIKKLHNFIKLGLPFPLSHFFISLLCFYFLGRILKANYFAYINGLFCNFTDYKL